MIKPIVKDILFLKQTSEKATEKDAQIIKDLQDTLSAHSDSCVGMAANMIGYNKRIIIVTIGMINMVMVNPKIVKKSTPYFTEEGCLSLEGIRKTKRYKEIEVEFEDINFNKQRKKYSEWTAQIIQHEIDHCDGIII